MLVFRNLCSIAIAASILLAAAPAGAQQGYEFEVYGPDIGNKGSTELELNSNYVADGLMPLNEGLFPTHHAYRSSVEISRTMNSWMRLSGYVNANARPGHSLTYVGNRIKVTMIAPSSWNLPMDVGIVNELSYSRPGFAENRWAYEVSPILAKNIGSFLLVLNPSFERGVSGTGDHTVEIEPRGKIGYNLGADNSFALEYYSGLGGVGENYSVQQQRHQIFGRFETEISPQLELNAGLGRGLTRSSDRWVIVAGLEYQLGR